MGAIKAIMGTEAEAITDMDMGTDMEGIIFRQLQKREEVKAWRISSIYARAGSIEIFERCYLKTYIVNFQIIGGKTIYESLLIQFIADSNWFLDSKFL